MHLSSGQVVVEVHVARGRRQPVGDLGQRQVVGGHEAEGGQLEQRAEQAARAVAAVVRVRAVEELVEQEQRGAGARGGDDPAQPQHLGVEAGAARLQRVLDAQGGAGGRRRQPQPRGAHRRAHQREDRVDADRAQQRRLARHVRPADDEHPRRPAERDVVGDRGGRRQQGMRQPLGLVHGRAGRVGDLGERVGGVLPGVGAERGQRLELAGVAQPAGHARAVPPPPRLDRERAVQVPEQEGGDGQEHDVVLPVVPLDDAAKLPGGVVRLAVGGREGGVERPQPRRPVRPAPDDAAHLPEDEQLARWLVGAVHDPGRAGVEAVPEDRGGDQRREERSDRQRAL